MASNGSDRRPVIGITTYIERTRYGAWDLDAAVLPRTYIDTVAAAGGNPVLLPPLGFCDVSFLDGLVIAGGADVDPARYGAQAHPETLGLRTDRDGTEFALVENALAAHLPLIGVCRGMQVLNVALGGTLTQHVPDVTGSSAHRPVVGQFGPTDVEMAEGSAINEILGGAATVSCSHHQAVDRLGDGLAVTARSVDGVVEAVELAGADFVLGVQWHPEQDAEVRLFKALVARAGNGK
ncbi:gamma-glutamyl-gamma-aminobutyrate hydrolase family protein [Kutzneria sp. CA-103260]|uniref:gamma-glutamyl-gamma-aminobutyrate hydrolase family protein n=1 Tax=Kutzneria sp. CA-103260 TaxID=2802641 RepID=UPI001BA8B5E6|nr:gamma-glutamyl-gamma-aminobutyrate hydrolase family protein [Kutzneria sp. CA-103260]QUQ68191.1 peptidase C26 [Kutzneria sp. CA-103260]